MNISKTLTVSALIAATSLIATPAHAADGDLAIDMLQEIAIVEEPERTSYDRDEWAPSGWVDADGTGCTTQQDILLRDTDPASQVAGDDGCTLIYGTATDP